MKDDRQAKLAKLRASKVSDKVVLESGAPFIDVLESKISDLQKIFSDGVEISNIDDLLDQLGVLQSFQHEVKILKDTIKTIQLPNVEVEGIDDLIGAIKSLEMKEPFVVEKMDISVFDAIVNGIAELTRKVDESIALKPSQNPQEFIPTRHVVKIGNRLVFDDGQFGGGGSGGNTIPIKDGSVPVVNPDGTTIFSEANMYDFNGQGFVRVTSKNVALMVDDTAAPVYYVGKAGPGTATSSTSWQIKKIDTTTGVVTTWANGNANFVNIWDNHLVLTYS